MALYKGRSLMRGDVALVTPHERALTPLIAAADLTSHQKGWLARAASEDHILYFCVQLERRPVGQIMLHDIEERSAVALVGYHIFKPEDCNRGTGTAALRLLSHYALTELGLQRLVVITGVENVASQRIAAKCGYLQTGGAREGPHLVAFELAAGDQQSLAHI